MDLVFEILRESWHLLQGAAIYVIFGMLVAGMLRIFLSPGTVARHLGQGKFSSVFKASLLGIPIPLCSCGVLPAAASLRKQGANKGATTAFLISTPESGVDSVALTYALLDPVMTVARPIAAFAGATAAGLSENLLTKGEEEIQAEPDLSCPVDGCCDGRECLPEDHSSHHSLSEKVRAGLAYALNDLWNDIAVWFLLGIVLAGLITALVPADLLTRYLGGGLPSMLIMLAAGIPLYICATASTPIAAALILKGVSPGAALVFLLVGPATNITSLTVLLGILGKRATAIYLTVISVSAVVFGLVLDQVYTILGISARAIAGQATEVMPPWAQVGGAVVILALSIRPVYHALRSKLGRGATVVEGTGSCCPTETGLPLADIHLEDEGCAGST
jgi:uncharacterized membrane protein YraQ (UPF0718 family)